MIVVLPFVAVTVLVLASQLTLAPSASNIARIGTIALLFIIWGGTSKLIGFPLRSTDDLETVRTPPSTGGGGSGAGVGGCAASSK